MDATINGGVLTNVLGNLVATFMQTVLPYDNIRKMFGVGIRE